MAISATAILKEFFLWAAATLLQLWHLITSKLPSKSTHSSPNIDLESLSPQPQPQPSSSNTTPESQSPQIQTPPSPQSLSGLRRLPGNSILDVNQDLELELPKTLFNLCFTAAVQITIQYKQVIESEFRHSIHFLALAILVIFASLFISHFIGKKRPIASKMLEKVAFFLAATTFFFALAIPFPLTIKFSIWAVYVMSLITIAVCHCL